MVISLLLLTSLNVLNGYGTRSVSFQGANTIVLIAGLLLGWRYGLAIALVIITYNIGLTTLEELGVLHYPAPDFSPVAIVINSISQLFFLAALQYFSVANLEKALKEVLHYKTHLEVLVEERTEKLRLAQDRLIHSEKMASLGTMATGVTHEINNPLNYIKGAVTGIEDYIDELSPEVQKEIRPMINAIEVGVKRATDIVSVLNNYSISEDAPFQSVDIHTVIDEALLVFANEFIHKITITKNFGAINSVVKETKLNYLMCL